MTINEAIKTYTEQNAIASAAKKAAEQAKKFILSAMGNESELKTDSFIVYLKKTSSTRLDTESLYRDFPDIKETYGKESVSKSIDVHKLAKEESKTA